MGGWLAGVLGYARENVLGSIGGGKEAVGAACAHKGKRLASGRRRMSFTDAVTLSKHCRYRRETQQQAVGRPAQVRHGLMRLFHIRRWDKENQNGPPGST